MTRKIKEKFFAMVKDLEKKKLPQYQILRLNDWFKALEADLISERDVKMISDLTNKLGLKNIEFENNNREFHVNIGVDVDVWITDLGSYSVSISEWSNHHNESMEVDQTTSDDIDEIVDYITDAEVH